MGKQKQQVISRFFAPVKQQPDHNPPSPSPPPTTPKVATTVSFSPATTSSKRSRSKALAFAHSPSPPPSKKPRPPPPNSSLHRKSLDMLLDTPPTSSVLNPSSLNPKHTPLEQQVVELKSKYPDVLLMVEVGYRYRFFGEDAETAANVLGIIAHMDHNFLTASVPNFRLNFHVRRLVGAGYKVGVVKQTETAAIKAHGSNRLAPFSRDLSALYTRSTIEAAEDLGGAGEEVLEASGSNYLLCVVEKGFPAGNKESEMESGFNVKIGIVAVEISTGDVIHGEFNDSVMRSGLEAVVLSLSPTEILLGNPLSVPTEKLLLAYAERASNVRVERTSCNHSCDGGALAEIISLYENISVDSARSEHLEENGQIVQEEKHHVGIEGVMAMPELAAQALALTIRYLKQFGFERILCLGASFRPFSSNIEMTLSANTLHQLEILKNNFDGSLEGSLLQAMNHTCTSFGSRLLKHWVAHPLCDKYSISARLDAVSEIAESIGSSRALEKIVDLDEEPTSGGAVMLGTSCILSSVLRTLGRMPDVQRGISRIFHRTTTPSEFIMVIQAILLAGKQLRQLYLDRDAKDSEPVFHSDLLTRLILTASSVTVISHAAKLLSSLNKDAADRRDMLHLFNTSNSQFPEVARGRTYVQLAQEKLDLLIVQYRKQLGICNLEFTSVSGTTHLIELPFDARVPSNWVKVNSTKKTARYHTPELLKALDELGLAKEEYAVTCRSTWSSFLTAFGKYYAQFQAVVQALAALDCLHSLAILSRNKNYVRPIFVDDDESNQIEIRSGRHPVLESILGESFVPNDTNFHASEEVCQIVTGPNMGGKSSYIRQVALIAIMAQVGSFVPATSMKLHVLDGIYTRMGVSDSIQQGTSTFFEELSEASHILHHCSSRSLVIIDELGRGTSTHDGVAIAYATLHHLLEQKKCMVLFVTHYPKIMDIQHEFPRSVGAYHVSYLTSQKDSEVVGSKYDTSAATPDRSDVTFLYKVVPGISDKSFGVNVARLAQLPTSCIMRAAVMAAKMEMELNSRTSRNLAQREATEMSPQSDKISMDDYQIQTEIFYHPSESFEEFVKSFKKLIFLLQYAFNDVNSNILHSLKDARKLALNMTNE